MHPRRSNAKSLQADPLASNLVGAREWLVEQPIEIPDISVKNAHYISSSTRSGDYLEALTAGSANPCPPEPQEGEPPDAVDGIKRWIFPSERLGSFCAFILWPATL